MPAPTNRYHAPTSPLTSDYAPPSPPRHATPGTRDAKSKAGHIALSFASTGGLLLVIQHASDQWRLLAIPLCLGACWPFLPMLQDWLITWHLKRHSETFIYSHDVLVDRVDMTAEEWSLKHNARRRQRQEVTLTKSQRQEALEAQNQELSRRLMETTRTLPEYTETMRAVVELARQNEHGIVSDAKAAAAGITARKYIPARDALLAANILYRYGQTFRLQPQYILASNPHEYIQERMLAA